MDSDWAEKANRKIDLLAFDKDCKELKPVSFKSVDSSHKVINLIDKEAQDVKVSVNGSSGIEIEFTLRSRCFSFLVYNNGVTEFNVFKGNIQIGGGALSQITENAMKVALTTGED